MRLVISCIALLLSTVCFGQFDPAGGQTGSKAIHKDDVSLSYWGDSVVVQRGNQRINASNPVVVSTGVETDALGQADNRTISLGDGGTATYIFKRPVTNIDGPDFVVFENGFEWAGGYFLELAFVEVSSDGKRFVRFPAQSMADTTNQIENLAYMECEWYHNLAGKHQAPYGTPFDLEELIDTTQIDLSAITHIRLVDVVGSVNDSFVRRDINGRKINDPWPTDFESGGFDLDGVGVLQFPLSSYNQEVIKRFVSPNPTSSTAGFNIQIDYADLRIFDMNGREIYNDQTNRKHHSPPLKRGMYTVQISTKNQTLTQRICVTQ